MTDGSLTPTERGRSLATFRSTLGRSAALWVGDGAHVIADDWWAALSGISSLNYNLLCFHGAKPPLVEGLALLQEVGAPAIAIFAGAALGAPQALADLGWVCVGTLPFMFKPSAPGRLSDDAVIRIGAERLAEARALMVEGFIFGDAPELARLIVPDSVVAGTGRNSAAGSGLESVPGSGPETTPEFKLWGLEVDGELRSCVTTTVIDSTLVGWSMATPERYQRLGYGRRLINSVVDQHYDQALIGVLAYSSLAGEPLYRSIGFEVLEHWQMWSKPRWMLGQS